MISCHSTPLFIFQLSPFSNIIHHSQLHRLSFSTNYSLKIVCYYNKANLHPPDTFHSLHVSVLPVVRYRKILCNMSFSSSSSSSCRVPSPTSRQYPVLIVDVMDTLIENPFHSVYELYGFSTFKDFIKAKNPTAWIDFEMGAISEQTLAERYFLKRGGPSQENTPGQISGSSASSVEPTMNISQLKEHMTSRYTWIPGMKELMHEIKTPPKANPKAPMMADDTVPIHLMSNYPVWFQWIEQKLQLSHHVGPWTFVSCQHGLRKPDLRSYEKVQELIQVDLASCIFMDDSKTNCDAALRAGFRDAILFENPDDVREKLRIHYPWI